MANTEDANTATSTLDTDNIHIQAMFKALRDSDRLLTLPPETLKALLLAQPDGKAATIVARELELHINVEDGDPEPYDHYGVLGRDWDRLSPTFIRDVETLGSLSGGTSQAARLVVIYFDIRGMGLWDKPSCRLCDDQMVKIVVQDMRDCKERKTCWDPELTLTNKFFECRKEWKSRTSYNHKWDCRYKVMPRSLHLLSAWHSRACGELVAQGVAGHVLPPELVEIISECFYDKALLSAFKV